MPEISDLNQYRLGLVERLAMDMYETLVRKVIADVRALPEGSPYSVDSDLKDVWEEFKDQLQVDQSIMFELYEEKVRGICYHHVSEHDPDAQRLLWLWSEGYLEQWVERDAVKLSNFSVSEVVDELYRKVTDVACNEPLAHVVEEDIESVRPTEWPEQKYVDLNGLKYPNNWLKTQLGDPVSAILQNLPEHEEELSLRLAEDYLRQIAVQGLEMPWTSEIDPGDHKGIDDCRQAIREEFVGFLRHWRTSAEEFLEQLYPLPKRDPDETEDEEDED